MTLNSQPSTCGSSPILKLTQVSKLFPSPNGSQLRVLADVSLEIYSGESLAIVGPSGSGKSTLLHIMGGLDRPTTGQVLLGGESLPDLDEPALAAIRNTRIGFVFQAHYLLPQCTVLENVLLPTLAGGSANNPTRRKGAATGGLAQPDASPRERALRLLDRVGLSQRLHHRPSQLSGGERQRAAVVRGLINQPDILLADEPTGALDAATACDLVQLLVELNREEHLALVTVTHSSDLARAMNRQLTLRSGRVAP